MGWLTPQRFRLPSPWAEKPVGRVNPHVCPGADPTGSSRFSRTCLAAGSSAPAAGESARHVRGLLRGARGGRAVPGVRVEISRQRRSVSIEVSPPTVGQTDADPSATRSGGAHDSARSRRAAGHLRAEPRPRDPRGHLCDFFMLKAMFFVTSSRDLGDPLREIYSASRPICSDGSSCIFWMGNAANHSPGRALVLAGDDA